LFVLRPHSPLAGELGNMARISVRKSEASWAGRNHEQECCTDLSLLLGHRGQVH